MAQNELQVKFEAQLKPILGTAYGLAAHLTRNRDEAEDLVQESALLAYKGFHTFQSGTNFKAWFFKILTNAYIQKYRRKRSGPVVEDIDAVPELYLYQQTRHTRLSGPSSDPARTIMDKIDGEQIVAAIDSLPEEYKIVATLYFIEEFSYQDIADIVEVPIGTVRSRLHRARKVLQAALWQFVNSG